MNEACVAVLFAYKLLHNFVKALDENYLKKTLTDLMPFVGSLEPLNALFLKLVFNQSIDEIINTFATRHPHRLLLKYTLKDEQ